MRSVKILALCLLVVAVCSPRVGTQPTGTKGATVLFEGARLIVGDGRVPIERSAFLVEDDSFTGIGRQGELKAPQGAVRVDLTGKTVMPALVDLHTHLGYTSVRDMSTAAANYTRANLIDHLNRYASTGSRPR